LPREWFSEVKSPYLSWLLAAVALHSIVLGIVMLAAPFEFLSLFGWEVGGPRFFPAQSGLFLLILGAAYAGAIVNRSLVWIVILSKGLALMFLVGETMAGHSPPVVYVTAGIDGAMGAAVAILWWRERR
jgi:hypothetical protein